MFRQFLRSQKPLHVVVENGRWDAFAEKPTTANDHMSIELLRRAEGVSDRVPDGIYHFTWKLRWNGSYSLDLKPVQD